MSQFEENITCIPCIHDDIKMNIYAECCNKYYGCNLCHNENSDHRIKLKKINKIKCLNCYKENPITNECIECKTSFSKKFCNICNYWSNKNFYHCYDCESCRIGDEKKYFHCKKCKICLNISSIDNHKCRTIDEDVNCPVCLNKINDSNKKIILLHCNHFIHKECGDLIILNTNTDKKIPCCPLCKKSIVDIIKYEKKFDKKINENPINNYYANWNTDISCNDCLKNSNIKYHDIYHKCNDCKSYNTNIIKINKIKN
jgi:RING finger/CHY zinc finger protein 1